MARPHPDCSTAAETGRTSTLYRGQPVQLDCARQRYQTRPQRNPSVVGYPERELPAALQLVDDNSEMVLVHVAALPDSASSV